MPKVTATSRLLLALQHIVGNTGHHPNGTPLTAVLLTYVGVPREDLDKYPDRAHILYARLIRLCLEAIDEVETCLDDPALPENEREAVRAQASAPVRNALATLTGQGVVRPANGFQFPDIGAIGALALATQREIGREAATADELAAIKRAINDLRALIVAAELPDRLKARFVRILRSLETAVDEYQYFGAEEALACLGAFLGVASSGRGQMDEATQKDVWEKFSRLVTLIGGLDYSYRMASAVIAAAPVIGALMK